MPNRNEHGCPGVVYRIDSRPPEVIFEEGFQTWGNNRNFFDHILGYSLGDDIPEQIRSGIISTSDSPDSSIRFFGSMMNNPMDDDMEYYLYEIRADENVYSALRTASFYQQRIATGLISPFEESILEQMIDTVDAIFHEFAYQREWFNVGNIPRERVRSAWRVDSVRINPIHIRHQVDTVYHTPRINEPEIFNPNFVQANTFANNLAYTEGAQHDTSSTVSLPSELVESSTDGDVSASLGFACSPEFHSSKRSKRSIEQMKIEKMYCYFDNKEKQSKRFKINSEIKKPFIFQKHFENKMYLVGEKTNEEFVLSFKNDLTTKTNEATLEIISNVNQCPNFIYDVYQNFTWKSPQKEFSYSLTPVYIGYQNRYKVAYSISSTNNDSQKWRLKKIFSDNQKTLFRIENIDIKNFSLFREKTTNKIYLKNISDKIKDQDRFEELFLVLSKNRCDSCILLQQRARTQLVDIGLSWFLDNQNYVPVPETGWSKESKVLQNTFFYDLNTYKIIYIDKNEEVFALYNARTTSYWNWIRWIKNDLKTTEDKRLQWYFQNLNWDADKGINFRNINSFHKNDYLRVIISGSKWGGFYTVNSSVDRNSIALFRINKTANI